jgi:hypothetical protein
VTERQSVIQSNGGHGSGQKLFFPPVWPYCFKQLPPPYIMWCRNKTEISDLPLCKTWLKLLGVYLVSVVPLVDQLIEREVTQLELNFRIRWPVHSSKLNCHICFTWGMQKRVQVKCKECDVELCIGVLKNTKCDILRSAGRFWSHKNLTIEVCKRKFHVYCNVFRWAKRIRTEMHKAQRMGHS